MKHEFGTIKVNAEIRDKPKTRIHCFRDITQKYETLGEKQKEHAYAVFLQNDNQEIGDKLLGLGGRDCIQIDIQDIVRTAALVNAAAVILIHNHPSGNPGPTQEDIETTRKIYDALDIIGVQLLDHVIITRNHNYSMKGEQDGPFQS